MKENINKDIFLYSKEALILNQYQFDKIIDHFCPVYMLNASYRCLDELKKYDFKYFQLSESNNSNSNEYEVVEAQKTSSILYHTFWSVDNGDETHHFRVINLNVLSFLATQDLRKAKLIIWFLKPFKNIRKFKIKFFKYMHMNVIELRMLDLHDLCSRGVFNLKFKFCLKTLKSDSIVEFSDFVRFLVLYHYGGLYIDGDVLFLRDMKPFWQQNFVYRWSFTHNYNTAVMGINSKFNENIEKLYEYIIETSNNEMDLVQGFYPTNVKNAIFLLNGKRSIYNYTGLNVYHSVLFDPAWLCNDLEMEKVKAKICKFADFYDLIVNDFNIEEFFPGAFTHHLHLKNCGTCIVSNTSYFYHFEKHFSHKLGIHFED